jgi:hypothetical protein
VALLCGAAASVRENDWPAATKAKAWGSPEGTVTSSTTSVPRLVWVNVQVTVSPGLRVTDAGALPSLHTAEVRSQPAGTGLWEAA